MTDDKCIYWGKKDGKPVCSLLIPEPDLYVILMNAVQNKVINEAITKFDNSNYNGQTVRKILESLRKKED